MTDKPIVVYWFTALACRPRPIQVATTSHLREGK